MSERNMPVLTLPNAPATYSQQHMDRVQQALRNHWHPTPVVAAGAFPMILATDYGVVGDGVTDDTVAMQAAINACNPGADNIPRVLYCAALKIKTSGALTMTGGAGIVFETGMQLGAGLYPVGTGFTALTFGRSIQLAQVRVAVFGNNQTLNGIFFDNPLASTIERIMVADCDGFGVLFHDCWDTFVGKVSVINCGNATNYALQIGPGTDTSNESTFAYLQCEQANTKAILIDDTTLASHFGVVHSEQATAVAGVNTWSFGGARGMYGPIRLHSNNPSAATARLAGENVEYHGVSIEGSPTDRVTVKLVGESQGPMSLYQPAMSNSYVTVDLSGHSGRIVVTGGEMGELDTALEDNHGISLVMTGTRLATLQLNQIGGNPGIASLAQFIACSIGTLSSSSTNSAATFTDCVIEEAGDLLEYATILNHCIVKSSTQINVRGYVEMRGCKVSATVNVPDLQSLFAFGTHIDSLFLTTANASLVDAGCSFINVTSQVGAPPTQQPATQSGSTQWYRGQRYHNHIPVSGQPTGWVCTTGGGNGIFVWKPEANLP